jgi:hypothetical protein
MGDDWYFVTLAESFTVKTIVPVIVGPAEPATWALSNIFPFAPTGVDEGAALVVVVVAVKQPTVGSVTVASRNSVVVFPPVTLETDIRYVYV